MVEERNQHTREEGKSGRELSYEPVLKWRSRRKQTCPSRLTDTSVIRQFGVDKSSSDPHVDGEVNGCSRNYTSVKEILEDLGEETGLATCQVCGLSELIGKELSDHRDQDHVDQEQVEQENVDQEHVDQEHVDQENEDQEHVDPEHVDQENEDQEHVDQEHSSLLDNVGVQRIKSTCQNNKFPTKYHRLGSKFQFEVESSSFDYRIEMILNESNKLNNVEGTPVAVGSRTFNGTLEHRDTKSTGVDLVENEITQVHSLNCLNRISKKNCRKSDSISALPCNGVEHADQCQDNVRYKLSDNLIFKNSIEKDKDDERDSHILTDLTARAGEDQLATEHSELLIGGGETCELCYRQFSNKYYLRKHNLDLHGTACNITRGVNVPSQSESGLNLPSFSYLSRSSSCNPSSSIGSEMPLRVTEKFSKQSWCNAISCLPLNLSHNSSLPELSQSFLSHSSSEALSSVKTSSLIDSGNSIPRDSSLSTNLLNGASFPQTPFKKILSDAGLQSGNDSNHIQVDSITEEPSRGLNDKLSEKSMSNKTWIVCLLESLLLSNPLLGVSTLPMFPGGLFSSPSNLMSYAASTLSGQSESCTSDERSVIRTGNPQISESLSKSASANQFRFFRASGLEEADEPGSLHHSDEGNGGTTEAGSACHMCGKEFCNSYFVKIHLRDKHGIPLTNVCSSSHITSCAVNSNPGNMPGLSRKEEGLDAIEGGVFVKPDPEPESTRDDCQLCGRSFTNRYSLINHLMNIHHVKPDGYGLASELLQLSSLFSSQLQQQIAADQCKQLLISSQQLPQLEATVKRDSVVTGTSDDLQEMERKTLHERSCLKATKSSVLKSEAMLLEHCAADEGQIPAEVTPYPQCGEGYTVHSEDLDSMQTEKHHQVKHMLLEEVSMKEEPPHSSFDPPTSSSHLAPGDVRVPPPLRRRRRRGDSSRAEGPDGKRALRHNTGKISPADDSAISGKSSLISGREVEHVGLHAGHFPPPASTSDYMSSRNKSSLQELTLDQKIINSKWKSVDLISNRADQSDVQISFNRPFTTSPLTLGQHLTLDGRSAAAGLQHLALQLGLNLDHMGTGLTGTNLFISGSSPPRDASQSVDLFQNFGDSFPDSLTCSMLDYCGFSQRLSGSGGALVTPGDLVRSGIDPEAYCDICQKEFCSKYFLKTHRLKIHGINSQVNSASSSEREMETFFNSGQNLLSHLDKYSLSRFGSSDGGASMESIHDNTDQIRTHLQERTVIHAAVREVKTKPSEINQSTNRSSKGQGSNLNSGRVTCDICSKELCNKYFLKTHIMKIHKNSISSTDGGIDLSLQMPHIAC